jgi:hypothetical protein
MPLDRFVGKGDPHLLGNRWFPSDVSRAVDIENKEPAPDGFAMTEHATPVTPGLAGLDGRPDFIVAMFSKDVGEVCMA